MNTPIEQFGKDHWSLFAYIESRCVDGGGVLQDKHMRNHRRAEWKEEWGTRLRGYFIGDDSYGIDVDKKFILPHHDDYDCLGDLEAAGMVKNTNTGLLPIMEITDLGRSMINQLREHKSSGLSFATFEPKLV